MVKRNRYVRQYGDEILYETYCISKLKIMLDQGCPTGGRGGGGGGGPQLTFFGPPKTKKKKIFLIIERLIYVFY